MLAVVHIVDQICGLTAFGRLWRSKADHNFRHPTEGCLSWNCLRKVGKGVYEETLSARFDRFHRNAGAGCRTRLSRGGFPVQVEVLAARSNIRLLEEQIREFRPAAARCI